MIVGRDQELARIRGLVEGARDGRGGGLVLVGPPGMGKTVLLDAAARLAGDLRVLRVTGVQAERDLPYAGLHALLMGLVEEGADADLPPQHRTALLAALGGEGDASAGRLALGAATLGLLAGQPGLLVLVDDLQWLDAPSADALMFASRRLLADPVAVIATLRSDGGIDPTSPAAGLPAIVLGPTETPEALLADVHPTVAGALAEWCGGNPLAMLESAAGLTPEEAQGLRPLPRQLPTSNPEQVYVDRLATLTPRERAAARILALAGRAPGDVVGAAIVADGGSPDDLSALEATGLCQPGARWRHPLARSACARGTSAEVRRAHRRLADAWGSRVSPARAWHLAEASEGQDQEASAALVSAAEAAQAVNASADAADAWERAARLTTSPDEQPRLLELAARAALRAGASRRAADLLDEALLQQPGPGPAASLLHLRARIEHGVGQPARALDLCLQAIDLSSDRELQVWAGAEGLLAAMFAGRLDQADRMAQLVHLHHDPDRPTHRFLAVHARGAAASLNERGAEAHDAMDDARALLSRGLLEQEPDLLLWAMNIDLFDPVATTLSPEILQTMDRMRLQGNLMWLPRVVRLAAYREMAQGRWRSALGLIDEAELLARVSGQPTQLAEALTALAEVDAVRGDADRAGERLAEARASISALGVPWIESWADWIDALAALTRGAPGEAVRSLRKALPLRPFVLPVLVDAVLRTSGPEAAAAELAGQADAAPQWRELAQLHLDPEGGAAIAEAADEHGHSTYAALLRVAAGERLRRAGNRREARTQLRLADTMFRAMDATPWVRRVEDELRASGATLRREADAEELTASELRVASLVAEGRSNKDVAAVLFLSPKTVEFHLGRAYRKLQVSNRTALAGALRDRDA